MGHNLLNFAILRPPVFPHDEQKTLRSSQVQITVNFLLGGFLIYVVIIALFRMALTSQQWLITVVIIPIFFCAIYILNRIGRVTEAAICLVAGLWIAINLSALAVGGVHSVAFVANMIVVLCAGLLFGRKWALGIVLVSLLAGIGFVIAELNGWYADTDWPIPPLPLLGIETTLFLVVLGLLEVATRSIQQAFQRAVASETRYRSLFEDAPGGLIVLDDTWIITMINTSASLLLGAETDELMGRDVREFMDSASIDKLPSRLTPTFFGPERLLRREERLSRKDGTTITALCVLHLLEHKGYLVTLVDITERQQMEQTLRENETVLTTIFEEIPHNLTLNRLDNGIYVQVNRSFCEFFGIEPSQALGKRAGSLEAATLSHQFVDPRTPELMAEKLRIEGKLERYEVCTIAKTQELCYAWVTTRIFPINNIPHALTMWQDITDRKLAEQALEDSYERTLEGWAKALDLRERETAGHSRRVVELTLRMALKVGIPSDQLNHIVRGALLHDIGKLGIPDSILLKPDRLTDEEWELMRQHPTYSQQLLSDIPFLMAAMDIPSCHHERWDGQGYPSGMKGTEIPLAARIFSLVDVWDALTSDRPYRPALSTDEALAVIQRDSGTHFDPALVPIFMQLIREDLALMQSEASFNDPFSLSR